MNQDSQPNERMPDSPAGSARWLPEVYDELRRIIDAFANQSYADPTKRGDPSSPPIKDWANWVRDNIKTLKSTHTITQPGIHTLKVWMVDPGVVIEKLVIHDGKLPKSYFGPPEVSLDRQ